MINYELIVIFKSQLSKELLDAEIAKMQTNISNSSGKVTKTEIWGRRELHSLLQGERHGQYVQIQFCGDNSDLVEKINNLARITETLLKFQVHRLGDASRKFKGNPIRLKNPITNYDTEDSSDDDYITDMG